MKKDNSGAFFKNDRREKDTHPNYTGTCMVDGVDYYLNVWNNTSKSGKNYCSVSFIKIVNNSDQARQAINSPSSSQNQYNAPAQNSYSNNTGPIFSGGVTQDNLVDNFEDDIPF